MDQWIDLEIRLSEYKKLFILMDANETVLKLPQPSLGM